MFGNVSVSTGTYMLWQTLVAVLTVISTGISLWRMKRGPSKDEMTYFREEVMNTLNAVKDDVESTTQRLEAHIDRSGRRRGE